MGIDQERSRGLFRKLDHLLARSNAKPQPERVHQVRTTTRRVEALLELLCPDPGRRLRKLRKRLKALRRSAGAVRDIDVQIAALRTLKIGRETERKSRLLEALADQRLVREQAFVEGLRDKGIRKLRKNLRRVEEELVPAATLQASDAAPAAESGKNGAGAAPTSCMSAAEAAAFDFAAEALRQFARLSREVRAFTADNLHAYRTRCKRVRYVAEMAGEQAEAKRVVEQLKRIQDAVGIWHDWVTLTQTADTLFARSVESGLVAALRNVTHAKFMAGRGVAQDASRVLLAEHKAMLARKRAERAAAAPHPGNNGGGAKRPARRPVVAATGAPNGRRKPKAAAETAQASDVA